MENGKGQATSFCHDELEVGVRGRRGWGPRSHLPRLGPASPRSQSPCPLSRGWRAEQSPFPASSRDRPLASLDVAFSAKPPGRLLGCELGPRRVPPPHPAPAAPSSRARSPAPSVPVLWPTRLPSAYCGAGAMPGPGRPRRASCRGAGCRGGTNHPTTTSTAGGRSGGHVTEKVAPEPVLKRQQPP